MKILHYEDRIFNWNRTRLSDILKEIAWQYDWEENCDIIPKEEGRMP